MADDSVASTSRSQTGAGCQQAASFSLTLSQKERTSEQMGCDEFSLSLSLCGEREREREREIARRRQSEEEEFAEYDWDPQATGVLALGSRRRVPPATPYLKMKKRVCTFGIRKNKEFRTSRATRALSAFDRRRVRGRA